MRTTRLQKERLNLINGLASDSNMAAARSTNALSFRYVDLTLVSGCF